MNENIYVNYFFINVELFNFNG